MRSAPSAAIALSTPNVRGAAQPIVHTTAIACTPRSAGLPYSSPLAPAGFTPFVAKTPVSSAPAIPATPWQATTSSASSTCVRLRSCTAKKLALAPSAPMASAESGVT